MAFPITTIGTLVRNYPCNFHRKTPALDSILQRGDDNPVAAAVSVVVAFIGFWWIVTHGKGTIPGRLAAWGSAIVVIWLFVAVTNPPAAGDVASAAASGTSTAIAGLGHFLADVFG